MAKRQTGVKKGTKKAEKTATTTAPKKETKKVTDITWKISSGSIMIGDKVYNAGQTFAAPSDAVPEAFQDTVKPLVPKNIEEVQEPVIKFFKKEINATDEEKEKDDFVQMYNVENTKGVNINPEPLTEEAADAMLENLN